MGYQQNKTIPTMKKLLLLLFTIVSITVYGQDQATKNKIKVLYFSAEELYNNKEYTATIHKIEEIETLLNGSKLGTAQNLKVKAYIGLKKYQKAKQEMEILQTLSLSDGILKEMASYSIVIDKKIEEEKEKIAAENKKRNELLNLAKEYDDNGLAIIKYNGKSGVINQKGDIVIPFKFDYIKQPYYYSQDDVSFEYNFAITNYYIATKWGSDKDIKKLFYKTGECLITANGIQIHRTGLLIFSEEEKVSVNLAKSGIFDPISKRQIIKFSDNYVLHNTFGYYLFPIQDTKTKLYGYINEKGIVVIKPMFKWAEGFYDKNAVECYAKYPSGIKIYLNRNGQRIR